MGCASSSPFISTVENRVFNKTKESSSNALQSGQELITDISCDKNIEIINETIIDAKQNIRDGIDNTLNYTRKEMIGDGTVVVIKEKLTNNDNISSDFKIIPLKDPNDKLIEDALDELASTMDETTAEIKYDPDKITPIKMAIENNEMITNENLLNKIVNSNDNTDNQSFDSLKTTSPEPEIERAFANNFESNPPTPKPTLLELEKLRDLKVTTAADLDHNTLKEMTDNFAKNISKNALRNEKGKKLKVIRNKKRAPKNKLQSNRMLTKPTKWEKQHDRLSKGIKKLERRKSSISIYSDDSTMFKKPHTLYLVFGNNFLRTPKIKIIESQKGSRWMLKPKQTISELNVYTGVKTVIGEEDIPVSDLKKPLPDDISRPRWNSSKFATEKNFENTNNPYLSKTRIPGSISKPLKSSYTITKEKEKFSKFIDQNSNTNVINLSQSEEENYIVNDDDDNNNVNEKSFDNNNTSEIQETIENIRKTNKIQPIITSVQSANHLRSKNIRQKTNLTDIDNLTSTNKSKIINNLSKDIKNINAVENIKQKTDITLRNVNAKNNSQKSTKNNSKLRIPKGIKPINIVNKSASSSVPIKKNKTIPRPIFNVVKTDSKKSNNNILRQKAKSNLSESALKKNNTNKMKENSISKFNDNNKLLETNDDNKISKSFTIADIVNKAMKMKESDETHSVTNSDKIRKEKAKLWLQSIEKNNKEIKNNNQLISNDNNDNKQLTVNNQKLLNNNNINDETQIVGETKEIQKSFFSNSQDNAGDFDNNDSFYFDEYGDNFIKNAMVYFNLY